LDLASVEDNVNRLISQEISKENFLFELLAAYGQPQSSITRLKNGGWNSSKKIGEVFWKKHLLFVASDSVDLSTIDTLSKSAEAEKHKLRFVIMTDFDRFLAMDRKTRESLDIKLPELDKHADFFLPWAGREKHRHKLESHADRRAAEKMGRLYNQISKDNPDLSQGEVHSLNVFLARLLFCFFAESSEIFPKRGMFTDALDSHTQDDGSDLHSYLDRLFEVMDIPEKSPERLPFPSYLQVFPYVNGGLFQTRLNSPKFSKSSRDIIITCGSLDWSEINPDIFGSMMQAVVAKTDRGKVGMHYTSVSNIMKVIEPLFLNELEAELRKNHDDVKGLERLLERLYNLRIFDPACGSGNFLIIAYKELRNLEMRIYARLQEINIKGQLYLPRMLLTQFSGIEVEDFAHETCPSHTGRGSNRKPGVINS
jgi:hypothetical protein